MNVGGKLDNLAFTATQDIQANIGDYTGKWLVFYFYPKDATPGCTAEGQDFRDQYSQFQDLNAEVFGISRDSLASHEKFKAKQNLPFDLISDTDETLCKYFDVLKLKKMFGKESIGIERSTFIIDPNQVVCHEWRKVKVKDHVNEVLNTLKELQS